MELIGRAPLGWGKRGWLGSLVGLAMGLGLSLGLVWFRLGARWFVMLVVVCKGFR